MNKRAKTGKKNTKIKLISFILLVLLVVASIPFYFMYSKLSKIQRTKIDDSPSSLLIDENLFKSSQVKEEDFINILLIGVDVDKEVANTNSADSIMIATIDKQHKKLKLTSIMRDSRVSVEGHGEPKLKYAYSYGGPQLLIKTINSNFKMNIKDYIKVDFFNFEKIIDYVGGVDINVKSDEVDLLNSYQKNIAGLEKSSYIPVKKPGLQTLNGKQAVAYCRIRYIGNVDFERTERQRTVMTEIFKKISSKNLAEMSNSLDKILPFVETSLNKPEMISLSSYIFLHSITKPEQFRIPTDQTYHDFTDPKDNLYYMLWDKEPTIDALHKFIFETGLYYPPQN